VSRLRRMLRPSSVPPVQEIARWGFIPATHCLVPSAGSCPFGWCWTANRASNCTSPRTGDLLVISPRIPYHR
jgi:hypothetical protein